ncbi:hypothetical protein D3C81_2230610 [compost metagenome]
MPLHPVKILGPDQGREVMPDSGLQAAQAAMAAIEKTWLDLEGKAHGCAQTVS